jgi:hypothetical protein
MPTLLLVWCRPHGTRSETSRRGMLAGLHSYSRQPKTERALWSQERRAGFVRNASGASVSDASTDRPVSH